MVDGKVFVFVFLCPYYRYIWGKCKDLQRRGKIHLVFCLGVNIAFKAFFIQFISCLQIKTYSRICNMQYTSL